MNNDTTAVLLAIVVGVLIATALYWIVGYVPHAHAPS